MFSTQRSRQSALALQQALDQNETLLKALETAVLQQAEHQAETIIRIDELSKLLLKDSEGQSEFMSRLNKEMLEDMALNTQRIVAVMEKVAEVAGIPKGDTPTVEELLAEARSDPARRKVVEQAMADLEFADTEIQFN